MQRIDLEKKEHSIVVGMKCDNLTPNIVDDSVFYLDGEPIGFYIRDLSEHDSLAAKLADVADVELRSERVPKQEMSRGPQGSKADKIKREQEGKVIVTQFSTILGGIPPKPHMRRNYPTISSVHGVKSAKNYIKSMILLAGRSEQLIKKIIPKQYESQKALIAANAPKKYRFGELFTSSISNFNIAADYHIDRANLQGCVNVIIAKRKEATGGNTTVPDYGVTVDSADNSMLVYPAWANIHGVTPIVESASGGYRNTLVFYPLASFKNYMD